MEKDALNLQLSFIRSSSTASALVGEYASAHPWGRVVAETRASPLALLDCPYSRSRHSLFPPLDPPPQLLTSSTCPLLNQQHALLDRPTSRHNGRRRLLHRRTPYRQLHALVRSRYIAACRSDSANIPPNSAREDVAFSERDVQLLDLVTRELAARSDTLALYTRAFDQEEEGPFARAFDQEEEEGLFARTGLHDELLSREVLTDDLFARDLLSGDLFARTYLSDELAARSLEQPRRENYRTHDEYERAFLEWNRRMRKMDHAFKSTLNRNEAQYQRHQAHASGSGSGGGSRARKPGAWAKIKSALGIGKKSRKGGRH